MLLLLLWLLLLLPLRLLLLLPLRLLLLLPLRLLVLLRGLISPSPRIHLLKCWHPLFAPLLVQFPYISLSREWLWRWQMGGGSQCRGLFR